MAKSDNKFERARDDLETALREMRFMEFLNGKLSPHITRFRAVGYTHIIDAMSKGECNTAQRLLDRTWRTGIYAPLQLLRKRQVQMNDEHLAISALFIDAAIGFLCALNEEIRSRADGDDGVANACSFTSIEVEVAERSPLAQLTRAERILKGGTVEKENSNAEDAKNSGQVAYKLLIYIGDLYRYRAMFAAGSSQRLATALAEQYYRAATLQTSTDGMALNQLGYLAREKNYGVDALYFYLCCISCTKPVENGELNMKDMLRATEKLTLSKRADAWHTICYSFMHYIAGLIVGNSTNEMLIKHLSTIDEFVGKATIAEWPLLSVLRLLGVCMMLERVTFGKHINKAQFQPYGAVVINIFVRAACIALSSGQLTTNRTTKTAAPIQNGDISSDEDVEQKLMQRVLGARRAGSDSDDDEIVELPDSDVESEHSEVKAPIELQTVTFDGNDAALAVLAIAAKYYQQISCKSWLTIEDHSMPLAVLRVIARESTGATADGALPEAEALRHCSMLGFSNGAVASDKQQVRNLRLHTIAQWVRQLSDEMPVQKVKFYQAQNAPTRAPQPAEETMHHADTQITIAPKEGDIEPIDFVTDTDQIVKIVGEKIGSVRVGEKSTEQVRSSSGERRRNGMLSLDILSPKARSDDRSDVSSDESDTTESDSDAHRERRQGMMRRLGNVHQQATQRSERQRSMWASTLIPDSECLMQATQALDEILTTGRFKMVVSAETLRMLDAQKATNPRARTATDWLLRKTSRANGPVRIQQRRDESVDINCLKTSDGEVSGILRLAAHLAKSQTRDNGTTTQHYDDKQSPTRVSILVSSSFGLPPFQRFDDVCRDIDITNVTVEYVHRYKNRVLTRLVKQPRKQYGSSGNYRRRAAAD